MQKPYTTHNDCTIDVLGTRYIGMVEASYECLTILFGDPIKSSDDDGAGCQWLICFKNPAGDKEAVARIYNPDASNDSSKVSVWSVASRQGQEFVIELISASVDVVNEVHGNPGESEDPLLKNIEGVADEVRSMMDSIRAIKGSKFASIVEIGYHLLKLKDMLELFAGMSVQSGAVPAEVMTRIEGPVSGLMARILGVASTAADVLTEEERRSEGVGRAKVQEIMSWVDRMRDFENREMPKAVKAYMESRKQGKEDGDD